MKLSDNRVQALKDTIKRYREKKTNTMFDDFYTSDLNIFEQLIHDNQNMQTKLEQLRNIVWEVDIPHLTCPEYIEHHRDIQKILKFIDENLLEEEYHAL